MSEAVSTKEIVVVFGSENHRRHYIKHWEADPLLTVSACFPELLGVMQVGEDVSIKVVRYPVDESWRQISYIHEDAIADTERRLESYRQKGMTVVEAPYE